eukprot:m.181250 g.181250  ORF g.181250 m.181250 type:complete len:1046 (-) comp15201_c0_seq1:102-3239(-)
MSTPPQSLKKRGSNNPLSSTDSSSGPSNSRPNYTSPQKRRFTLGSARSKQVAPADDHNDPFPARGGSMWMWPGNQGKWKAPSGVAPTQDEWRNLEAIGRPDISTPPATKSQAELKTNDPLSSIVGLNINNFLLSRSLRRQTLAAAVQDASWTRFVGGGTIAQYFRLKESIVTARILHILISFIVWQHFFLHKYARKLRDIPEGDTNEHMKRILPAMDFGTMHMVLLQFALLPVTVSRSLLAWISTWTTALPLDQVMTMHIQIGYTFGACMVVAPASLNIFLAKLCWDASNGREEMDTCHIFTSEIMLTGYMILVITYVMMITAYYRGYMQYEKFFKTHVTGAFLMYCMLTFHTIDNEARHGRHRTQTFRWVVGSIAIFVFDRAWRYITQQTRVPVITAITHADGGSVTLKLIKPWWFTFVAGQYVHIQVPEIDGMWHPFSIASSPEWSWITLIIAVVPKEGEWTKKLSTLVSCRKLVNINVRGPFGNPIGPPADANAAANIIAVGTGTGIVPMVSLLKVRADMLSQLSGSGLAKTQSTVAKRQAAASMADCLGANISPATNEAIRHFQLLYRKYMLDKFRNKGGKMPVFLKQATDDAASSHDLWSAGAVLVWVLLEVTALGLMLSWNNLEPPAYQSDDMKYIVEAATWLMQIPYAILVVFKLRSRKRFDSPEIYIHILVVIFNLATLSILTAHERWMSLHADEQVGLSAFAVWRLKACWDTRRSHAESASAASRYSSGRHEVESFKFLWVTRSAELAIALLTDLDQTFRELEHSVHGHQTGTVGTEAFRQLELKVWCTDRRKDRVAQLKTWLAGTRFEKLVVFGRPDFDNELVTVMRRHIMSPEFINRLPGEKKTCAVTFCGAPLVSGMIFDAVKRCGQLATVAGAPDFQFLYRTEFYGTAPPRRRPPPKPKGKDGKPAERKPKLSKKQAKLKKEQQMWSNMRQDLTALPAVTESDLEAGELATKLSRVNSKMVSVNETSAPPTEPAPMVATPTEPATEATPGGGGGADEGARNRGPRAAAPQYHGRQLPELQRPQDGEFKPSNI